MILFALLILLASISWGLAGTPLWLNMAAGALCIVGGIGRMIWLRSHL